MSNETLPRVITWLGGRDYTVTEAEEGMPYRYVIERPGFRTHVRAGSPLAQEIEEKLKGEV